MESPKNKRPFRAHRSKCVACWLEALICGGGLQFDSYLRQVFSFYFFVVLAESRKAAREGGPGLRWHKKRKGTKGRPVAE